MTKQIVRSEEELRALLREELVKSFLQLETADGYEFTPIDFDIEVDRILSNEGDVQYPSLSCIECSFTEIGFTFELTSSVTLFTEKDLVKYINEIRK